MGISFRKRITAFNYFPNCKNCSSFTYTTTGVNMEVRSEGSILAYRPFYYIFPITRKYTESKNFVKCSLGTPINPMPNITADHSLNMPDIIFKVKQFPGSNLPQFSFVLFKLHRVFFRMNGRSTAGIQKEFLHYNIPFELQANITTSRH